ncbi:MAG: zf-HC2 domain-containing protein [Myxococcales bacterium]
MTVVGLHPEELFDKLLDGELLPAERERLRAHLDGCEVCRFEYAARLDFQQEALELGALRMPPALPLRPLPVAEAAPSKGRRRRSRRLVWGLAAAALISASGAVASGVVGQSEWHSVQLFMSHRAAPPEHDAPAPAKPARPRVAASSVLDSDPPLVDARLEEAPALAVSPLEPPATPASDESTKRRGSRAAAPRGGSTTAPASVEAPAVKEDAPAPKDPPAKEPTSAAKLFGEANQARRSGDIGRASGLYHLLQDQFPGSPEADLSRVTLALLLLDSGDAQGALSGFERYLAGASRGLEAEALVGRARALGRLGRRDQEAVAWREVQRKYPGSIYGRQASERLAALGQP